MAIMSPVSLKRPFCALFDSSSAQNGLSGGPSNSAKMVKMISYKEQKKLPLKENSNTKKQGRNAC